MIRYTPSLDGVTPAALTGFFEGWRTPLSSEEHLRVLRGSAHVVLAINEETSRVVGFVNALTDGSHSAFIPLLEVLPAYRRRGIGSELLRRMLEELRGFACVDLTCDPALQPFYEKAGMTRAVGMGVRNPSTTAARGSGAVAHGD